MTPPPIQSFDDFSKKVVRGFDQFAQEKMGTAEETTQFPPAYLQLDEKVDKIKTTTTQLGYLLSAPPIGDSFMDAIDKLNVKFDQIRNRPDSTRPEPRIPATIQHATAEVCLQGADLLSRDNIDVPAADLLQRYGQIQAKLGEARLEFSRTLVRKFIEPFATYSGAYENANRARRSANRVRLELDACKAKMRAIRGVSPADLQSEVDLLEKEFNAACEEAIMEMKSFVQYVHDPSLTDLII